jgi:glutamine synthetase
VEAIGPEDASFHSSWQTDPHRVRRGRVLLLETPGRRAFAGALLGLFQWRSIYRTCSSTLGKETIRLQRRRAHSSQLFECATLACSSPSCQVHQSCYFALLSRTLRAQGARGLDQFLDKLAGKEAPMSYDCQTPEDVLRTIKDDKIEMIDLRFTDLPGLWQHFSAPPRALDLDSVSEGIGFDGSSIRGFQEIQESDMLVIPDPTTAFLDPFAEARTLVLICNIRDPITGQSYSRDVRYIAQKAENYLKSTAIGDASYFGPELEHFVFNEVRYDQSTNYGYYEVDAVEANWNAAKENGPSLGHKLRPKEGYFPVPPSDLLQDARSNMVTVLESIGVAVEAHHHEVATGGQGEIDMRFAALTRMADNVMIYKYVVKNVAHQRGMTATFMPKPLFGDNGSGMHVHQSIWKGERPLFAGEGYAGSSELMRYYIGGLLKHAPALLAICAPTVNSYRRLVPGFEAPVNLGYSQRNRSAAVRIPMYSANPKTKRVEFRCPDPACNPYLAFAAMLMAGLDGIRSRIDPGEPIDKNLYDLPPAERAKVPSTPGTLDEALSALEADHQFLLEGEVFTDDVVQTYINYKRSREIDEIRLRPHPYEFLLYYDV